MENEFNKILEQIISSKRIGRKEGIKLIKQQIEKDNITTKQALNQILDYMENIIFDSIFKNTSENY